jgi:hypothetical protein
VGGKVWNTELLMVFEEDDMELTAAPVAVLKEVSDNVD